MMRVFLVFVILWGSHLSEQSSHCRHTFPCSQHFDKQVCRLCILLRLNARNADSFLLWNSNDCLYLIPASRLNRVHKNQSLRTIFVKFMMINGGSGLNHDYPLFQVCSCACAFLHCSRSVFVVCMITSFSHARGTYTYTHIVFRSPRQYILSRVSFLR